MDKNELWNKAKEELKTELTDITYKTWILPTEIVSVSGNHIVFLADSLAHQDLFEHKYYMLILDALKKVSNKEWTYSVVLENNENSDGVIQYSGEKQDDYNSISYNNSSLNPRYTFDTFVVGNNNRFAHAAALAVGDAPFTSYNPLYIYGGVGLGKTHLLHAIGNKILKNNKNIKILYVTSETFTNQLINAIKDAKMEIFRNKYRNIDVLLIDDIQFIAGKERIQEEFFHTFNTLYENQKQIILTSDQPPKQIKFLEDRLVSRFEWGLLADISCPDYETRLAILRKKAQDENIVIDDFILSNIASKIDSNIRELEGIYNKIVALASLTNEPITIELAENEINSFISNKDKKLSTDYIQEKVAKYFGINKADLNGNKRSNNIAFPRQIAMYLCREVANMSFPKIGEDFGNRDHSTVMHAHKKIEKEIKEKDNTRLIVESVKENILKGE
jgi:chromosomal replication initiator protein